MKSIGAKNRFILSLFLSEALLIGLIGSTLGIFMGFSGAYVLTDLGPRTGGFWRTTRTITASYYSRIHAK